MTESGGSARRDDSGGAQGLVVEQAFVLLFAVHVPGKAPDMRSDFVGVTPLPAEQAVEYLALLAEFETRLLGKTFRDAGRITRSTLGRIALDGLPEGAPTYADAAPAPRIHGHGRAHRRAQEPGAVHGGVMSLSFTRSILCPGNW